MLYNFKPWKKIDLHSAGGDVFIFADIDGDGNNEIITRQSGGMFDAYRYEGKLGEGTTGEDNWNLNCTTCLDFDGDVRWQSGRPWQHAEGYRSHASANTIKVRDIDGDGKPEYIFLFRETLSIGDALTGEIKKSVIVEQDSLNMIFFQELKGEDFNIIVKCDGQSPYGYCRPFICYDRDLKIKWQHNYLNGAGHNVVFADVDNDGNEEILEGYNVIDHDGRIIRYFSFPSHADQISIADINDDGIAEIVYCNDREDFIVCTLKGAHLYTISDFAHPQRVDIGNFMPNVGGLQMFLNNRTSHGGSYMLDHTGKILFEFPCPAYTFISPKKMADGTDALIAAPTPGRGAPDLLDSLEERAKEQGYEDLPIKSDGSIAPFVLDGQGRVIQTLPFERIGEQITDWYKTNNSWMLRDVDGDGKAEYVLYNKDSMTIFKDEA